MIVEFNFNRQRYFADLSTPLDLSIRLRDGADNPNCFWAPQPEFSPVRAGDFVGATAEGGPVNFFNIRINPHGNGTHTECVGHISREPYFLPDCLRKSHFIAKMVSVYPQKRENGDRVVDYDSIKDLLAEGEAEALIIRTLPNDDLKCKTNYSGANPPYISAEAMAWIVGCGIEHLLVDLPSVDREEDGGALSAHKIFWNYPASPRMNCTITELIYAPPAIRDGLYLLHLQVTALHLDASPSKPEIFPLHHSEI